MDRRRQVGQRHQTVGEVLVDRRVRDHVVLAQPRRADDLGLGALLVLVISLPGAIKKAVTMLSGGGGGGGGGGGADVGKIAKGMGKLLGRSAASGDVGGKKVKASTATRLPSFGGSKKDKELNSPQRV